MLETPNYDPKLRTISSLGYTEVKSLFSIALILFGSTSIPFFIYLKRELMETNTIIRTLATGISIFTGICICTLGIIPDKIFTDDIHLFTAGVAFTGSCISINLYSILIYFNPKSKLHTNQYFKVILASYLFIINFLLVILLIDFIPIIEWILFISIYIWFVSTAVIALLKFE